METKNDNLTLKILHETFYSYSKTKNYLSKAEILRLFFENKLIDICDFNIFLVNHYLNILSQNDKVSFEKFLQLVFFIYAQQLKVQTGEQQEMTPSERSIDDINDMSNDSVMVLVANTANIDKYISLIKVLMITKNSSGDYFDLVAPNYDQKDDTVWQVSQTEAIETINKYSNALFEIFHSYSEYIEAKAVEYLNIFNLIKIIWKYPIYSNIESKRIATVVSKFLYPNNLEVSERFVQIFDDPKNTKDPLLVKAEFENLNINSDTLNFTFSTFALLIGSFATEILENKNRNLIESIEFFFKTILELPENRELQALDAINQTDLENLDEDEMIASKNLESARRMQTDPSTEDMQIIQESLEQLDKDLPDTDLDMIRTSQNEQPNQSNNNYHNAMEYNKLKFPLNRLKIEQEEEEARILAEKERIMIEKARKATKRNARDPPIKPAFFEEKPTPESARLKYFGTKTIEDLKNKFIKNSYRDIIANTNVAPSLIKEVLLLPKAVPVQVAETVTLALRAATNGNFESAIHQMERAEYEFGLFKISLTQVELFFSVMLGSFYESLDLNLMALNYYMTAKSATDKLDPGNPDAALSYCYLGGIMIRLREYDWALRCFNKAKTIREVTIGGDATDTATIYNNLGVCCYYLEAVWPANGYFKLAYEIFKERLGIFHARTMQVKSNIQKLDNIKFSKQYEFKTNSVYKTVTLTVPNPKKVKKK